MREILDLNPSYEDALAFLRYYNLYAPSRCHYVGMSGHGPFDVYRKHEAVALDMAKYGKDILRHVKGEL